MIRTQISLTGEQMERLRREAARTGKSQAQLMREALDRSYPDVSREERRRRIMALAGRFPSRTGDVSVRHDEYRADDVYEKKLGPA